MASVALWDGWKMCEVQIGDDQHWGRERGKERVVFRQRPSGSSAKGQHVVGPVGPCMDWVDLQTCLAPCPPHPDTSTLCIAHKRQNSGPAEAEHRTSRKCTAYSCCSQKSAHRAWLNTIHEHHDQRRPARPAALWGLAQSATAIGDFSRWYPHPVHILLLLQKFGFFSSSFARSVFPLLSTSHPLMIGWTSNRGHNVCMFVIHSLCTWRWMRTMFIQPHVGSPDTALTVTPSSMVMGNVFFIKVLDFHPQPSHAYQWWWSDILSHRYFIFQAPKTRVFWAWGKKWKRQGLWHRDRSREGGCVCVCTRKKEK